MPDEKIRLLLDKGKENLVAQVHEVSRLLEPDSEGVRIASIAAAQAITHQIKGTSGSIGFAELSTAASALDDKLKTHLKRSESSGDVHSEYGILLASLRSVAERTMSEHSILYDADFAELAKP